jgi:hypothetical protein
VYEAAAGWRFSVTENICASFVGSVLNISAPVYAQTIMEASLLSTLMTAPTATSACAPAPAPRASGLVHSVDPNNSRLSRFYSERGLTSTHYDDQMSRWLKLVRDRTYKIPAL